MEKSLNDRRRELQEYMDSLPENWEDDFGQVFVLATKYLNAEEYTYAIQHYDRAIELNPDFSLPYNNKAVALSALGKKKDVIDLHLKALGLSKGNSIVFSNVFRQAMWQNKLKQTIPLMTNKPSRYTSEIKFVVEYAIGVATPHKVKYFEIFDDMSIGERCDDYEEYFWVPYIFKKTRESTVLRAYLIALCETMRKIKRSLIFEDIKTQQVGHYTRIESIKHLVVKEPTEKNRLRLNNIAYMNDPSEGHVFLDLLNSQILSDYYFTTGKTGTRQVMNNSDTYLGSFSTNVDSLPMWVQYGNNGQGCCLIFNHTCFDAEEPITPMRIPLPIEMDDTDEEEHIASPKYCLYEVIYTDSIDDLAEEKPLLFARLQRVSELLSHIDREMRKIGDASAQEELRRIVINAIDQIRFLFKNTDFAHENELRIVTTSFGHELIADDGKRAREIPHLYVMMDKELEYDEIILGPKVEKPSEVVPYIYHTGKVKRITKSSIKYQ